MGLGIALTLLGIFICPLWRAVFPERFGVGYAAGLAVMAAGCAVLLGALVKMLRARRAGDAVPNWRPGLCAAIFFMAGAYLVAESVASIYILASGQRAAFSEFRYKDLGDGEPKYVPHPFLMFVKNSALPGVNRLGFNGPDWAPEKPAGTIRVACIGASTTEDGYPEGLAAMLRERLPGRSVEVLNFGVSGWSSAQSLVNYSLNVRHFAPDYLVIHDCPNDYMAIDYPDPRTDYAQALKIPELPGPRFDAPLERYSSAYALARWTVMRIRNLPPGPDISIMIRRESTSEGLAGAAENVGLVAGVLASNVEAMARLGAADGARTVVMTVPWDSERAAQFPNFPAFMAGGNEALRAMAARDGLALIDLEREMDGLEEFHIDAVHWNAEGVEMKSRIVCDALAVMIGEDDE